MYYKVKIKSLPKAKVGYQVNGALANDISAFGGKNIDLKDHSNIKVTKSITAVPRKDANLEAEGGETVIGNIDGSKIPSFFNIEGPRHTKGGVPLNLPDDSFIFSDTKAMMITDPTLLKMFNMPTKKGGYTPAEMSKKFDINKYREILQNKNSDKLDIKTAEMMIKNYVMKLGALALAQEAKKGFPQGIPKLSQPYMEASGISEEDLIPKKETQKPNQQSQGQSQKNEPTNMPNGEPVAKPQEEMMQYGGGIKRLRRAQKGGPKDTIIYPPGDSEYMNQPPLNYDILEMLNNKRRLEYNDYMRDQKDPTNINNAPPAYRERFLAKPKTVQAQEGMQQPSEEEMMMMQQQQAQQEQQPQQGGQDQQMMQIMQQVAEALQQGAEPEELTAELLQGQIPPEAIMQIFAQLGMPQEQVQQLVMGVMQQMQGGQEEDPRQQQQQMSEEEMMAMQQQDPSQMQQAPMAAYGMSMGGYDMPFYDDQYEMAYGGMPKYSTGGPGDDPGDRKVTRKEFEDKKYNDYTLDPKNKNRKTLSKESNISGGKLEGTAPGGGSNSNLVADLCSSMKKKGSVYYGKSVDEVIAYALGHLNKPKYADARVKIATQLEPCRQKGEVKITDAIITDDDNKDCLCKKTDGTLWIDANGNTKEAPFVDGVCQEYDITCKDPKTPCVEGSDEYKAKQKECNDAGKKFNGPKCDCEETTEGCTEGTDVYNKAKAICDEKGEKFDSSICNCVTEPEPPEWWLQDTVNTMGAASDLASVKKYMPWEARVDLEEPRPTFLDPTRELAQQSEQANIASQASASFAGAQGLGARNAASQGQGAAQAANTLSNINNQNVNIANQFEGTQVGIRNQESMLNQQMANRVFDKNTIANQQFDNAKLAGRQNLRNSYNTAVTNKWKTDALNQMYPNYQTETGVGGRVTYIPTDKTLDTKKRKDVYAAAQEYCDGQGYKGDKGMNACMELYLKYHSSQYGGESFENGGYVYTVYPNY